MFSKGLALRTVCWLARAVCCCLLAGAVSNAAIAADQPLKKLVMLDFEIIDETMDTASVEPMQARLAMISKQLREAFVQKHFYEVVDNTPQAPLIEDLKSRFKLYDCNGCEIDIAKALHADRILTAWVQKVSNLILNINIEIKDAASGNSVLIKSVDIRGNTDQSWSRGIAALVRSMEEKRQANR